MWQIIWRLTRGERIPRGRAGRFPLHDAGTDAVLQSKDKEKGRFRSLRNRPFCALEGAARRTAEAVAVHRRAAGGRAFLVGRVVDLHAVGVGVVVALDPELEPGPDVVIGFGLPLGRLHLSIEDAAHDGGDEGRDAHHDEDAEDAEVAVRVVVVIQRLAVLGVEIQRIGAQVDVGLGCVGVVAEIGRASCRERV